MYIKGAPIAMTRNSPVAVVIHPNKNGSPKAIFNSMAMKNIIKEKMSVEKVIWTQTFRTNLQTKIVKSKAKTE